MIAPCDIPVPVLLHKVHDAVCAGTAVEDVAEKVQLVYGKVLYHLSHGYDEVVGSASRYDGVDDDVYVGSLVKVVGTLVE